MTPKSLSTLLAGLSLAAFTAGCACEPAGKSGSRPVKPAATADAAAPARPAPAPAGTNWTTVDAAQAPATSNAVAEAPAEGERIVREYPDGSVEAEGYMLDGQQHGKWVFYWPNGNRKGEGRFDRGVRTGQWTFWEQDGHKATAGAFDDGKPDGRWEHWYANGIRKAEQNFTDGLMDGVTRTWDEFGRLQQEVSFSADVPTDVSGKQPMHGPFKQFSNDGVVLAEGQYDHGMKAGVWVYRYPTGQINKCGRYYDGEELGLWIHGKEGEVGYKAKKRLVAGRTDIIDRDFEMMTQVFGEDRGLWPVSLDAPRDLDGRIRPGGDQPLNIEEVEEEDGSSDAGDGGDGSGASS